MLFKYGILNPTIVPGQCNPFGIVATSDRVKVFIRIADPESNEYLPFKPFVSMFKDVLMPKPLLSASGRFFVLKPFEAH